MPGKAKWEYLHSYRLDNFLLYKFENCGFCWIAKLEVHSARHRHRAVTGMAEWKE